MQFSNDFPASCSHCNRYSFCAYLRSSLRSVFDAFVSWQFIMSHCREEELRILALAFFSPPRPGIFTFRTQISNFVLAAEKITLNRSFFGNMCAALHTSISRPFFGPLFMNACRAQLGVETNERTNERPNEAFPTLFHSFFSRCARRLHFPLIFRSCVSCAVLSCIRRATRITCPPLVHPVAWLENRNAAKIRIGKRIGTINGKFRARNEIRFWLAKIKWQWRKNARNVRQSLAEHRFN